MPKIVITGAAGLVGQNLVARLKNQAGTIIVGLDKHPANTSLLRQVHPEIDVIEADLSQLGDWTNAFSGADAAIICHAQIGGLRREEFVANNVTATANVLSAIKKHNVSYIVHISSSVVNSLADDLYCETKRDQEALVAASGIPFAALRPTLMFGWFDRKHLGWLRRFMERTPFFPIPGEGRYARQPLYVGDFVSVIGSCLAQRKTGIYDISGLKQIDYGAVIEMIHDIVKPRARVIHLPYRLFWILLWLYALFDKNPPFTTGQLEALVIPEIFPVTDWPGLFGVRATPLRRAFEETFLDPQYSAITLQF